MSPPTHQDSPKVPEWPLLETWRWSDGEPQIKAPGPVSRKIDPAAQVEHETYIPLSALLSDEVVEAVAVSLIHSHRGEAQSSKRPVGEQAREHYLPIAREALQAAIEQVGGAE